MLILSATAFLTSLKPGSEIVGVPESDTKAISIPDLSLDMTDSIFLSSLCSKKDSIGRPIPYFVKSLPVCLVSSAKIKSTFFRTSRARKVISCMLPIGVETKYKVDTEIMIS